MLFFVLFFLGGLFCFVVFYFVFLFFLFFVFCFFDSFG